MLLLAGCTTSPLSRIDANRGLYDSWPVEMRQAVLDGRVVNGMTPEMVEMSIGKPSQTDVRTTRQGTEEVWIYGTSNTGGLRSTSVSIGVGPIAVGGLGGGVGSNQQYREVGFVDGKVVSGGDPEPVQPGVIGASK